MISRGFASWGTRREKIYISQGWVWVKVRRKLQGEAAAGEQRIKKRKEEFMYWRAAERQGVKKVRTGLKVQGEDLWYPQREGEKRNEWIEGKNGTYLSGIPAADLWVAKEATALKRRGENTDPLISLLFSTLWPSERKCITNQFNPVLLMQLCSFTWCAADTSAKPTSDSAWPGARARAKASTPEAGWTGRGTPLMAFWHQVQRQWKCLRPHLKDLLNLPALRHYPYSNEGSLLLFFDLSPLTCSWWTGSVVWTVGHKLTEMSKLISLAFQTQTRRHSGAHTHNDCLL